MHQCPESRWLTPEHAGDKRIDLLSRPCLLDVAGTAAGLDEGTRWMVGQMLLIAAGVSVLIVVWQFRRGLKLTRFANA